MRLLLLFQDPPFSIFLSSTAPSSILSASTLITLDEELEHVLSYINIQKARFPGRLKIVTDIDDNIHCKLPPFSLQPIVDNAIRYGVLKRAKGGTVSLSVKKLPRLVRITVKDDGAGMTGEQLDNLFDRRNRHHSLYRINRALKTAGIKGLEIKSAYNDGTVVTMEIPS